MILHDGLVVLTQKEFRELPEYSTSLPTGTTIGKKWKRQKDWQDASKGWLMGEYIPNPNPKKVGIHWREVVVWENDDADSGLVQTEYLAGILRGEWVT